MIVRLEVFVERQEEDAGEAMFNTLLDAERLILMAKGFGELFTGDLAPGSIRKIRLPDSPEPDVSGYLTFD